MHKKLELSFINKNNEPVQFHTVTYTFEIDEYLSKYKDSDDINISLDEVRKDFQILLQDMKVSPLMKNIIR